MARLTPLLLSMMLLQGCASLGLSASKLPDELVTCERSPVLYSPETMKPEEVASYIVNLYFAGKDCRDRLDAIRRMQE